MSANNAMQLTMSMTRALHTARWLALATAVAYVGEVHISAITLVLTRNDIERALALARAPRSDAERAQFHRRYVIPVNRPAVDPWVVEHVEVITEFRRLELMAEEHARLNDLWARSMRAVDEAIRPWRGRVSIVVHLGLRATSLYVGDVPAIEVALGGPGPAPSLGTRQTALYGNCIGDLSGCALTGGLVEHDFEAAAIGQTARPLIVRWRGIEVADVIVDFASLE